MEVKCVLCLCSDSSLVQVGVRHASEFEVRSCKQCGLVFLWPRPSPEELASYYAQEYREEYGDRSCNQQYALDVDEAGARVKRVSRFVRSSTHLLDVGSGSGAFLDSIRPYVHQAVGVEPHEEYRRSITRGLNMQAVAHLEEVYGQAFDVITMFHVLEHVQNPLAFLRQLHSAMKSDGFLLLEVPNVDDVLVSVYGIPAYLRFYYQKAHLYYFSKTTLNETLNQAGFAATIEGIQRYDLSNHIRWMLTGQPGGQGYYKDILLPPVDAVYADGLIRAGRSDTLWVIGRRKTSRCVSQPTFTALR